MGVLIGIPIDEVTESEELPTKTYRLDLDTGRIIGYVDGIEAVRQAIRKAIITPRYKCLIYNGQYGSEIEDAIITNSATRAYIEMATAGFIKDALKPDTRILDVGDINIEYRDDSAYLSFKVSTIYGELNVEEVV